MRTSNPIFRESIFNSRGSVSGAMTVSGTVNKTFILLALVVASATLTWVSGFGPGISFIGGIVGFVFAMITIFKKEWAPVTAPLYALAEGVFIGGFSAMLEMSYPGIVIRAVVLTFGTLFCLLGAYRSGLIPVTERFRLGVISATGAIAIVYLIGMVMSLFGVAPSYLVGGGLLSIGLSVVVVAVAALNLVLDFDFIEQASDYGAPKYMEWVGAFGLMVTLVWLYIEILRLLSKLKDRER
jgi:uncharacterized YccA/Bax inhibitor family protein